MVGVAMTLQITATHQLQTAVTSLALVAHAIILASSTQGSTQQDGILESDAVPSPKETLVVAMFDTLLGMDANDPPKTLATLQLYCSVFSSVRILFQLLCTYFSSCF
jgi:proteasome activator subunit 4